MRSRTYSRLAYIILVAQIALIGLVFVVPGVKEFFSGSTIVAWVLLFLLGITAWALMPLTKQKKWRPKPRAYKPKPRVAKATVQPPLAAAAQTAQADEQSARPSSMVKRTKEALAGAVQVGKAGYAVATTFFGEKAVTAAVLALGAQFGVPSGTVMFILNVAGVEDTVTAQKKKIEKLETRYSEIAPRIDDHEKGAAAVRVELTKLDREVARDSGRLSTLEKLFAEKTPSKMHVEIIDRRPKPEETQAKPTNGIDISELFGRAILATSTYWRGQYCEAAHDLTSLTAAVKPLPPTMANLKGIWLWRLGDLVGAEKCFTHATSSSQYRSTAASLDEWRKGVMGLAQTYCMRRNYCDVYRSKRYEGLKRRLESSGISCEASNDQFIAEAILYLAGKKDAGFKEVLRKKTQEQTEFARICSLAIEHALDSGFSPEPNLQKLADARMSAAQSESQSCGVHVPLNCPLALLRKNSESATMSKQP